ncbi:uncharacterized protein LOC103520398, partial [Diaphorina citri]|uniref:Uncharacterized protein LOC103520398 n=1 Tax=Diaphorina citri TaxID=121845 RepID=A0A1S3DM10_DIACI
VLSLRQPVEKCYCLSVGKVLSLRQPVEKCYCLSVGKVLSLRQPVEKCYCLSVGKVLSLRQPVEKCYCLSVGKVLSLRQPVEKCYCLSVGKVSYGRETIIVGAPPSIPSVSYGRETIIVGAPPSIPSGSDSTEYPPTHRLVVHHLKGAWTTSNRDVVFALFESFMKNQQLKKNLSTAALKSFRASDASSTPLKSRSRSVEGQITPPSSSSLQSQVQVQNTPSPMSKLQSGQAASMLQQLIAEVENKAVVFSDDLSAQTREQHLQVTYKSVFKLRQGKKTIENLNPFGLIEGTL